MTPEQKTLIEELTGTRCRCGETKSKRMTFCRRCYFSLPVDARRALYRTIGNGYEAAHAAAVRLLDAGKGGTR